MSEFLFSISVRAMLVLAVAFVLAFVLRRSSASARHLLWAAMFACLLALPVLSSLPEPMRPVPLAAPALLLTGTPAISEPPAGPAPSASRFDWPGLLSMAWLAGATVVWGRLLIGLSRLAKLARNARAADPRYSELLRELAARIGARSNVALIEGARGAMPMAWGLFRPVILLPEDARRWPNERLRLALAHEMVHVARHDSLTQRAAQFVCGLYWFLPPVWLAAARLRKERELACDDRVLALGAKPSDYAQALLDLARSLRPAPACAAVVSMAQASELEGRVVALLDPSRNRRPVTRGRALAVGLATVLVSLALLPKAALPQNAGGLAGVVRDASGAAVPGAVVLLTAEDLKQKEIATTSDAGEFGFRVLPAGTYNVRVTKPGFAPLHQSGIAVRANALEQLELTLQIGGVSEVITVAAKAPAPPARTGPPRRIRVGGAVQATRLVHHVKPEYPESARQRGVEGTVLILGVISKEGALLDVKPMNTLVDPELTQAALDAVRQWRYEPTLLNGQPVEVETSFTVNFKLTP